MKDKKIPKLLDDAIKRNTHDIDVITKNLKLPWLKLDLDFGVWDETDIAYLRTSEDWRTKWKFSDVDKNSYQVRNWNGKLLFGPEKFDDFLELSSAGEHDHDEDSKCRFYREKFKYGWYETNTISRRINSVIPDNDLNLVNSYVLPPDGYVFPHRDYAIDGMGLAKIYIAVKWSDGNVFGQYGCGDIPIKQGDVFLINNYSLPHWVRNGSDEDRIVLDISANLHSSKIKESIIRSFKRCFGQVYG
jgi:hypothetical protein